jgi:hypothetical protein
MKTLKPGTPKSIVSFIPLITLSISEKSLIIGLVVKSIYDNPIYL